MLTEEGEHLVLDISDNTGGLGLKLFFKPWEAHRLGEGIMEKARFMVAKATDDPARTEPFTFPPLANPFHRS